jgi:excisionase family DNA binding protein
MTASVDLSGQSSERTDRRPQPMLTRDDTAAYLAVSKRTLDRLVHAGEVPAYRISGHRRFRIEDLERFIRSKRE